MNQFHSLVALLLLCSVFYSCNTTSNSVSAPLDTSELVQEYISLSQKYIEMEEYDQAIELLQKAKTYDQNNHEITFMIARTSALAEQWDVSLENYNTLLSLDNQNLLLLKSIAWVYAASGDIVASEELYKDIYGQHPYDKDVATNYIYVLAANKKTEEAKTVLDEYASLYPDEENLEELRNTVLSDSTTMESETP